MKRYVQCVVLRVYALRENGEMRVASFLYNKREWLSGGVQPCQGWGRGFDPRLALLLCKKTDFQRWKSVFALHSKVYHILLFIDRLTDLVCKRNQVVIVIDSFVADYDILQCGERLRRD